MFKRLDLNLILAHNLQFFMDRSKFYKNANALAVAAGVAANTVRNCLNYKKRTVTSEKPEGFPTLDSLANLASKLDCAVWELLHPDIEQSIREREMYAKVSDDYAKIMSREVAPKPYGVETDRLSNSFKAPRPPKLGK